MTRTISPLRIKLESFFASKGFGLRAKLVLIFVVIKVIPLLALAMIAWSQSWKLGEELKSRTAAIISTSLESIDKTDSTAVEDAVQALDERATHEIERASTDAALAVANFLYERDADIRFLASLPPGEQTYRSFAENKTGRVVKQGKWELTPNGSHWREAEIFAPPVMNTSSLEENARSFHYRPPERFIYENKPLYHEITFVDIKGHERIKVVTSPLMDKTLKDVSLRHNTFVKAETYFEELDKLKAGEIYVSEVTGEYVGSRVIGMYTPANAARAGVPYEPTKEAYAGKENPLGRRFQGIVRWAMPVEQKGKRIGYVTMALNHDHIMEFMAHIIPTDDRYAEISDASAGNYAFIWDYKGKNIVHPRHHSIVGFDAATGEPQIPWLEDRIYDDWKASELPYREFIQQVPVFRNQSRSKKPAGALTKAGLVALDCRYLNFAPQCTGWMDLVKNGGSGSLRILWSGVWKLNTAAAIPYYTGRYADSKIGFGFVAIGAGLDDFHRPALETQKSLKELIDQTEQDLRTSSTKAYEAIADNLMETAVNLSVSTIAMVALVILIAIWMAAVITRSVTRLINGISRFQKGERQFRFREPIKDELGQLADSFDDMAESLEKSASGFIVILDEKLNIRYMNRSLLDLLGKNEKEAVGNPYEKFSIFPPKSGADPLLALLQNMEAEPYLYAPTQKYYRGKAEILRSKEGRFNGYIITTTDVTSILLEQERLARERSLLDTIFNSSPDLMAYIDADMRYQAVNKRYAALYGLAAEDVPGRYVEELVPENYRDDLIRIYKLCREQKTPVYAESKYTFADGHEEHLDIVRSAIFNDKNELLGYLSVSRDVSLRVKIETTLRNTQVQLENTAREALKASEAKSNFLARMSHEIRTPMNAIIGMTEIIRRKLNNDGTHGDELPGHIQQIARSANHLLGLINDILDISKIEAGKINLVEEAFDMRALLDNVYSIILPRCEEKAIKLEVDIDDLGKKRVFEGDSLRIRQVLINLLGNAAKFTPECGWINFSVKLAEHGADRDKIFFSIKDSGIGIPESSLKNIFNPFEQAEGHLARRYGGTGLGLTISSNIVRMMGGTLEVQSEEGKGSDFYFSIWLKRREELLTDVDTAAVDMECLADKRLLLVDDVDINRMILTEILADTGLVIDEAEDGKEAVDMFEKSPTGYYDIIFMDVQMPHMNGYDATMAIRGLERPDAETVPIIALTANAFKEDVEMAIANGMNAHLAKPVEIERVMETLTVFLCSPKSPNAV